MSANVNGINPNTPQIDPGVAAAQAAGLSGAGPTYSMTPQGVLAYCEDQMQSINAQFNEQVEGIQSMNNDSTMIGNLKAAFSQYSTDGINYDPTANSNQGGPNETTAGDANYNALDSQLNSAIAQAQQEGNTSLVSSLTAAKNTFETNGTGGSDKIVSASDITSICNALDTAASGVTSNQQVSMITVGQIANTLNSVMTQMSQIIQGMDQTTLKIASNT
jgi:hypothetical protein